MSNSDECVRVIIRVRPEIPSHEPECDSVDNNVPSLSINQQKNQISISRSRKGASEFTFTGILGPSATQDDCAGLVDCAGVVDQVVQGVNCCVMAYGQTGSGKTYSMFGDWDDAVPAPGSTSGPVEEAQDSSDDCEPGTGNGPANRVQMQVQGEALGITPRCVLELFGWLEQHATGADCDYSVDCQLLQIYNEKLFDLLQDRKRENALVMREARGASGPAAGSVYVAGLSSYRVASPEDVFRLMRRGLRNRVVRGTDENDQSSRSHSVLQLQVQVECPDAQGFPVLRRATLSLVDLAGSERWRAALAQGSSNDEQKEQLSINSSLHALGICVSALLESNRKHIPFRNSNLTRLLQDALSGNGRTVLLATVREGSAYAEETLSTLQFAARAARIKSVLVPEERARTGGLSVHALRRLVEQLRTRVEQLQLQLQAQGQGSSGAISGTVSAGPASAEAVAGIEGDGGAGCGECSCCGSSQQRLHALTLQVQSLSQENAELRARLQRADGEYDGSSALKADGNSNRAEAGHGDGGDEVRGGEADGAKRKPRLRKRRKEVVSESVQTSALKAPVPVMTRKGAKLRDRDRDRDREQQHGDRPSSSPTSSRTGSVTVGPHSQSVLQSHSQSHSVSMSRTAHHKGGGEGEGEGCPEYSEAEKERVGVGEGHVTEQSVGRKNRPREGGGRGPEKPGEEGVGTVVSAGGASFRSPGKAASGSSVQSPSVTTTPTQPQPKPASRSRFSALEAARKASEMAAATLREYEEMANQVNRSEEGEEEGEEEEEEDMLGRASKPATATRQQAQTQGEFELSGPQFSSPPPAPVPPSPPPLTDTSREPASASSPSPGRTAPPAAELVVLRRAGQAERPPKSPNLSSTPVHERATGLSAIAPQPIQSQPLQPISSQSINSQTAALQPINSQTTALQPMTYIASPPISSQSSFSHQLISHAQIRPAASSNAVAASSYCPRHGLSACILCQMYSSSGPTSSSTSTASQRAGPSSGLSVSVSAQTLGASGSAAFRVAQPSSLSSAVPSASLSYYTEPLGSLSPKQLPGSRGRDAPYLGPTLGSSALSSTSSPSSLPSSLSLSSSTPASFASLGAAAGPSSSSSSSSMRCATHGLSDCLLCRMRVSRMDPTATLTSTATATGAGVRASSPLTQLLSLARPSPSVSMETLAHSRGLSIPPSPASSSRQPLPPLSQQPSRTYSGSGLLSDGGGAAADRRPGSEHALGVTQSLTQSLIHSQLRETFNEPPSIDRTQPQPQPQYQTQYLQPAPAHVHAYAPAPTSSSTSVQSSSYSLPSRITHIEYLDEEEEEEDKEEEVDSAAEGARPVRGRGAGRAQTNTKKCRPKPKPATKSPYA